MKADRVPGSREVSKSLSWAIGFACFLLIPNLLFWLIGLKVYLVRGIFVAEYFILGILFLFKRRKLFIVLWILFNLFDLLYASASLFFMDFFEMMDAAAGLKNIYSWQLVKWILQVLGFILLAWGLLYVLLRMNARVRFIRPLYLLSYLVVIFLVDLLGGGNTIQLRAIKNPFIINANLLSAPSVSFISHGMYAFKRKDEKLHGTSNVHSVAKTVFDKEKGNREQGPKQLLILVESWGSLMNKELEDHLLKPFHELAEDSSYKLTTGTTGFKYLTQMAEMREVTGHHLPFSAINEAFANKNSLFIKKQQDGYRVIGVHGYSHGFYNRKRWWPLLGIQEMYFAEQLKSLGLPFAGNVYFRGAADTAIGTWVFKKASEQPGRKEFYYWVTLNTHLPLEERKDEDFLAFRKEWLPRIGDEEVVDLSFHLQELFQRLARLMRSSGVKMEVLIIGDHAPPFVDPGKRRMFSPDRVPYVLVY